MTLQVIPKNLGDAGTGLDRSLYKTLRELQLRKLNAVAGAAANTNIALAGAKVGDTILSAVNLTDGVDIPLANISVTSAGNVRITTDTAAKKILIDWATKP